MQHVQLRQQGARRGAHAHALPGWSAPTGTQLHAIHSNAQQPVRIACLGCLPEGCTCAARLVSSHRQLRSALLNWGSLQREGQCRRAQQREAGQAQFYNVQAKKPPARGPSFKCKYKCKYKYKHIEVQTAHQCSPLVQIVRFLAGRPALRIRRCRRLLRCTLCCSGSGGRLLLPQAGHQVCLSLRAVLVILLLAAAAACQWLQLTILLVIITPAVLLTAALTIAAAALGSSKSGGPPRRAPRTAATLQLQPCCGSGAILRCILEPLQPICLTFLRLQHSAPQRGAGLRVGASKQTAGQLSCASWERARNTAG